MHTSTQTIYITEDGQEFRTESAAKRHEATLKLTTIFNELVVRNGTGYSTHKVAEYFANSSPAVIEVLSQITPSNPTTQLYFESHITCTPVEPYTPRSDLFTTLCLKYSFRPAKLWLQTRNGAKAQRSNLDTFATGRDTYYPKLLLATRGLITDLQHNDFQVLRYKIENTLLDSKLDNVFGVQLTTPI